MSEIEKKTVPRDEVYQAGSQGTQQRLNRETGEVEEVPSDPATTPAPGIVDENPPLENEVTGRTKAKPGERGTAVSNRGSDNPLVDRNYRPVADPETHDGPVFEYSPTTDGRYTTGDDDEDLVTPEDNAPDEKKTFEQQREDNRGATPGNLVAGSVSEEESVYAVSGTDVPDRSDDEGATGSEGGDTYEADKARATEKVPTSASNKQEIKDYLIYQHGVDPDDLEDQSKAELLELVDDLAE